MCSINATNPIGCPAAIIATSTPLSGTTALDVAVQPSSISARAIAPGGPAPGVVDSTSTPLSYSPFIEKVCAAFSWSSSRSSPSPQPVLPTIAVRRVEEYLVEEEEVEAAGVDSRCLEEGRENKGAGAIIANEDEKQSPTAEEEVEELIMEEEEENDGRNRGGDVAPPVGREETTCPTPTNEERHEHRSRINKTDEVRRPFFLLDWSMLDDLEQRDWDSRGSRGKVELLLPPRQPQQQQLVAARQGSTKDKDDQGEEEMDGDEDEEIPPLIEEEQDHPQQEEEELLDDEPFQKHQVTEDPELAPKEDGNGEILSLVEEAKEEQEGLRGEPSRERETAPAAAIAIPTGQAPPVVGMKEEPTREPFFVLDWMLDDLAPRNSSNVLRKSRSCDLHSRGESKKTNCGWFSFSSANLRGSASRNCRSPSPSPTSGRTDPPGTPKSSNRKSCRRVRRMDDFSSELFVPLLLQDQFDRHSRESAKEEEHRDGDGLPSSSAKKKSASCPQFINIEDTATASLKLRRQEQLDRRERRSKLTILQRSLSLAQKWDNKGLSFADQATQAEAQQEEANSLSNNAKSSVADARDTCSADLLASSMNNGIIGLWENSIDCWNNALEVYSSLLGPYHERVANVQNNRGIAFGKLRRYQDAMGALHQALEAWQQRINRNRIAINGGGCDSPNNSSNVASSSLSALAASEATSAIVTTLHNIANIHSDAREPMEALSVLLEAKIILQQEQPQTDDDGRSSLCDEYSHQSARLSTAIGHVYYDSEVFRSAREHYEEALVSYEWSLQYLSSSSTTTREGRSAEEKMSQQDERNHHCDLIQQEIGLLRHSLNELDRRQQAQQGSRSRLFQALSYREQLPQNRSLPQKQRCQQQQRRLPSSKRSIRAHHREGRNENQTQLMSMMTSLRA